MILIIFVFVILILLFMSGRNEKFTITPGAKKLFEDYINSHPEAKKQEQTNTGIDDLVGNIEEFFGIEMTEKEHSDVVRAARKNNNEINEQIMQVWIDENTREIYPKST